MERLHSFAGFFVFILIAYTLSRNRRGVQWRFVAWGVALQFSIAFLTLQLPWIRDGLLALSKSVMVLQEATEEGTSFVFGFLGGGELPFEETAEGASYVLAFRVLPLILVVSALSAVLFHWGVLPFLIRRFAQLLRRGLGLSGPLGFSAAASVFVGTIEAPLLIRPYLANMKRGELLALMSCVMATVAGTVMVVFATLLEPHIPGALGHLVIASVISVPAALVIAHVLMPETASEMPEVELSEETSGTMDALMMGTQQGVRIVFDIAATIIVLFTIVALANRVLGLLPSVGEQALTVQGVVGYGFRPLVWLMGIPWNECATAGEFMGTKTVLNEFVAYIQFSEQGGAGLSERSRLLLTYSLCGFANFGSLGIVLGGLNSIIPERKKEVVELGFWGIFAGTLATMMTGAVIGVLG